MGKYMLNKCKNEWRIYGIYTIVFIGLALVIRIIFGNSDSSYVWSPDGEFQYFPIMVYSRAYIIDVVKDFLQTGHLEFPMWDFSIGQGNNVLSVLSFNPFLLLSLLTTSKNLETVYGFIALLQWYCAGIAFIIFCRRIGKKETVPVLLGTLVYTFCGYAVFSGTKHIYFVAYLLIYLPLILTGVERYLQERKWGFYVCMITLSLTGGYYYAFMNSLLMAVYLIFRQLAVNGRNIKKSIVEILKLFGLYLWAFALSMIVFLPKIINYFICSRSGQYTEDLSLLYPLANYKTMFSSFATLKMDVGWTQTSFAGIALIAVIVLFLQKGKYHTVLRSCFVTLTAFMCLPIAGKIFNGFGYVSSRWCYGYAFFMSLLTVFIVPKMYNLTRRQKIILSAAVGAYIVSALAMNQKTGMMVGTALLIIVLLIVLLLDRFPAKWIGSVLLTAVTVGSSALLLCVNYMPEYNNGVSTYVKERKMQKDMGGSVEALASDLEDDTFYRVEVRATRSNRFVITGGYGTSSYWSTLPAKMVDYYLDFAMDSVRQNYALWGLDERAAVCTLSSVKYDLCADSSNGESIPYGFTKIDVVKGNNKDYAIYENQYALPLGYTYTACISEEAYEQLSPIERQQAMLQCAVVDETEVDLVSAQPQLSIQEKECSVEQMEGVIETGDHVYQAEAGGTITFSFDGDDDAETYLYLKDLIYDGKMTSSKVTVQSGKVSRATAVYNQISIYYFEREGITFNLGYSQEGKTSCTVSFENAGTYSFSPVIMCFPMEDYVRDVTERGEVVMENIVESADRITGSLQLDEKRLLVLTIPNYGGWEAYVNGEKAKLLDVNTMYMGLLLDAGDYEIELRYTTPGLTEGAAISGAAAAALILVGISGYIKRRKHFKNNNKTKEA